MKTVSISGSPRANVGKKDAKALRREGKVPCVIYGGKEQVTFIASERDFTKLLYTPDVHIVNIALSGKTYNAILQETQFHPLTDKLLHADFLEIIPGKAVTMSIPVRTKGSAVGVKEGGQLQLKHRHLKAKGVIEKMPDSITLDVTNLKVGDSIHISDLKFEGITFLEKPNVTVVGVRYTRVVEETPVAAATTAVTPVAGATPAAGTTPAPEAKKDEKKEEKKDEKKK